MYKTNHNQNDDSVVNLIKSRTLIPEYYNILIKDSYKHFNITDIVVCFFDGKKWNAVLLEDMQAYPVLYFDFWVEKENAFYVNTLLVCPITMRSMIYKGKIQIEDIVDDKLKLYNTDTKDTFFMESPYTGHYDKDGNEKKIKSQVKRYEVKMVVLRDAYMFLMDMNYIVVKSKYKQKTIIDGSYYTNRLTRNGKNINTAMHPKTIVYIVQYYSRSMKKYMHIVIVGKDADRDRVTGYGYKASGVFDFIDKHKEEYIEKRSYIYPIFWFMIEKLYPDAIIRPAS